MTSGPAGGMVADIANEDKANLCRLKVIKFSSNDTITQIQITPLSQAEELDR